MQAMSQPMAEADNTLLHRTIAVVLNARKGWVRALASAMIVAIALVDWRVKSISLAGLYILPMLLAAAAFPLPATVALAVLCAFLRCALDVPESPLGYAVDFGFSLCTFVITGLFVTALVRNRQMALQHLEEIRHEQGLRSDAEEQLRAFAESSPAAILTLDREGKVLAANRAADALFAPEPAGSMTGRSITPYVPVLRQALRLHDGAQPFRTSVQSMARKGTGEIFLADIWFSTYRASDGGRLAAIVVDSSEELRNREEQKLRQLSVSSRVVVAGVLHEVRNLCSAISVMYSNLTAAGGAPPTHEAMEGLGILVRSLTRVASLELYGREQEPLEEVALGRLLDDLRIVIEPSWQDIGGRIRWRMPSQDEDAVLADRHGLLQVFLNLAQNSHRAVQTRAERELAISVSSADGRTFVRFEDSGCGIADPEHLFQPFQEGADVTGLGLFISRVLVRSYGGELRYEPHRGGACFVVELCSVNGAHHV